MYYIATRDGFLTWDDPSYPSAQPVCRCQANIRFAIPYKTYDEALRVAQALIPGEYYTVLSTTVAYEDVRNGVVKTSRKKAYVSAPDNTRVIKSSEVAVYRVTQDTVQVILIDANGITATWPEYLWYAEDFWVLDGQPQIPRGVPAHTVFGCAEYLRGSTLPLSVYQHHVTAERDLHKPALHLKEEY